MPDIPHRIEVSRKQSVVVTWEDGDQTELSAAQLREACMCAACRQDSGALATAAVLSGTSPVTIEEAELVGGYALRFTFGPDDHTTGIYPFDILRQLGGPPGGM